MAFSQEEGAPAPPAAEMDSSTQAQAAAAPAKVSEDSFGTNNQVRRSLSMLSCDMLTLG